MVVSFLFLSFLFYHSRLFLSVPLILPSVVCCKRTVFIFIFFACWYSTHDVLPECCNAAVSIMWCFSYLRCTNAVMKCLYNSGVFNRLFMPYTTLTTPDSNSAETSCNAAISVVVVADCCIPDDCVASLTETRSESNWS